VWCEIYVYMTLQICNYAQIFHVSSLRKSCVYNWSKICIIFYNFCHISFISNFVLLRVSGIAIFQCIRSRSGHYIYNKKLPVIYETLHLIWLFLISKNGDANTLLCGNGPKLNKRIQLELYKYYVHFKHRTLPESICRLYKLTLKYMKVISADIYPYIYLFNLKNS
jgi:hypothetical protein